MELYVLLRNPAILKMPLSAPEAVKVIQVYRRHPVWKISGFPPDSSALHQELWDQAKEKDFARRGLYDVRTAFCLRAFGVTKFATADVKDFMGLGFAKVWNPFIEEE